MSLTGRATGSRFFSRWFVKQMLSLSHSNIEQLHEVLEGLYRKYNRFELIKPDPLQFVYRYTEPGDMEVAGFLAAALAYGRVQQIENSVDNLLGRMGKSPFEFIVNFDGLAKKKLKDFKHRFNTAEDVFNLLELLVDLLRQCGSIERYFLEGYHTDEANTVGAVTTFCDSLLHKFAQNHDGFVPKGLMYLLASPSRKSASKRLNLFLRWMVRDDAVDAGLWKSIDAAKLIVPVDVHMARLCRLLGLYKRKTVSLSAALEITAGFAQIAPADPTKYDFALSRIGIVENCVGRYRIECQDCELLQFCEHNWATG